MIEQNSPVVQQKTVQSTYLDRLRSFHQYQGRSNDCGPHCAALAINMVRKKKISGATLGKRMGEFHWKGLIPRIHRFRNWATFPWGIRDVLREEQIYSQWKIFQTPETIRQLISTDVLIIVIVGRFFPTWAHYKILAAHDPKRGYGFIDSAYKTGDLHWDTAELFEKQWKNYGSQVICVYPQASFKKRLAKQKEQ